MDSRLKRLHIAVADVAEEGPLHRGIIFDPQEVHAPHHGLAQFEYEAFFVPATSFRMAVVATYLLPANFSRTLTPFRVRAGTWFGGVLALIVVHGDCLDAMFTDLCEHPDAYLDLCVQA